MYLLVLILSLLIAAVLSVDGALLAVPGGWPDLFPFYLVVIYWVMRREEPFGVATAWVLGILLDVLLGEYIGWNALALAVVAIVVVRFRVAWLGFSIVQQGFLFAGMFCVIVTLEYVALTIFGAGVASISVYLWALAGALAAILLWPILVVVLDRVTPGIAR